MNANKQTRNGQVKKRSGSNNKKKKKILGFSVLIGLFSIIPGH